VARSRGPARRPPRRVSRARLHPHPAEGLDHILFVVGLFLLAARLRPVLVQVTTFTVAHSITLGLALYGVVALPAAVVEPLIALSIVYVAVENLRTRQLTPARVALVFVFGLLHGLGFAGELT
jgi:hydrogenase/urease accessory protein HupE